MTGLNSPAPACSSVVWGRLEATHRKIKLVPDRLHTWRTQAEDTTAGTSQTKMKARLASFSFKTFAQNGGKMYLQDKYKKKNEIILTDVHKTISNCCKTKVWAHKEPGKSSLPVS